MKCPKCEGLMYVERFADYFMTFQAWKCINCGVILDETILLNKSIYSPFEEAEPGALLHFIKACKD
jgi:transposase-like protein